MQLFAIAFVGFVAGLIFLAVFLNKLGRNPNFFSYSPPKGGGIIRKRNSPSQEIPQVSLLPRMGGRIRRLLSPRWWQSFWLCLRFRLKHGRGIFDPSPPKFTLAEQPEEQDPSVRADEVIDLAPTYHKDTSAKAMVQAWLFTRRQ